MKKVTVIAVVVGALDAISTRFEKYVETTGIDMKVGHAQKIALLGTGRILTLLFLILNFSF